MQKLKLEAKGREQELILAYLQENALDALAEKINNGAVIEKDGKKLISKKTLDGFMDYAHNEARKLADKGASCACIEDKTVYGWAMHYFEEDSIEGVLYNEDGTAYAPSKPTPSKPKQNFTPPKPKDKPDNAQCNFFDIIDGKEQDNAQDEDTEEETEDIENDKTEDTKDEEETVKEVQPESQQTSPKQQGTELYQRYMEVQNKYPNEIILIRLGDFFEALGKSAKTLGNIANLTLTGRDCGLEERVPMCGIPYHAEEIYIKKITKYCAVRIIDQDGMRYFPMQGEEKPQVIDHITGEIYDKHNEQDDLITELLTIFNNTLEVK